MPARQLPARPDPRQLKHQAKDLLRAAHAGDATAVDDFRAFHPERIDPATAKLSDAQLVLARSYDVSSWPRLVTACALIDAIWRNDVDAIRQLVSVNPYLQRGDATGDAGWRAVMTRAADHGLRQVIETLRGRGARNVEAAMERPDLQPLLDNVRLLGRVGAQFPRDAMGGAVETLDGATFAFMVDLGTKIMEETGEPLSKVALALETSARNPAGKHRVLEVMATHGVPLPDTPPMAVHRGRLDLLERHLQRDPALLTRTWSHREIWPPELGCHADESLALHGAPLAGATLLHMAVEYEELETARWLLDRGMDVDVRADVDATGFGGHTALFNCVVTYNAGRRDDSIVRLLLDRGADVNARASLRKRLAFAHDTSGHEYREVTPLGWGRRFHDQSYVSQVAMKAIAERGGTE